MPALITSSRAGSVPSCGPAIVPRQRPCPKRMMCGNTSRGRMPGPLSIEEATMTIITLFAVFLAGIVVEHIWLVYVRKRYNDDGLHRARAEADFWREQCNQWHRVAAQLGASKRKPKRIVLPDPPQAQIVAVGNVGLRVSRN